MNMRIRPIIIIFSVIFCIFDSGCRKLPNDQITKAIASTNAVFQTTDGSGKVIQLSPRQTKGLKQIVERFGDASQVRTEKDIPAAPSGIFILGDVYFGWFGSYLYIHDSKPERYYVIDVSILGQMALAYDKAMDATPPLSAPSEEKWREILSTLEKSN